MIDCSPHRVCIIHKGTPSSSSSSSPSPTSRCRATVGWLFRWTNQPVGRSWRREGSATRTLRRSASLCHCSASLCQARIGEHLQRSPVPGTPDGPERTTERKGGPLDYGEDLVSQATESSIHRAVSAAESAQVEVRCLGLWHLFSVESCGYDLLRRLVRGWARCTIRCSCSLIPDVRGHVGSADTLWCGRPLQNSPHGECNRPRPA